MPSADVLIAILLLLSGPAMLWAAYTARMRRLQLRNDERRVVAFASELGHARDAQVRLEYLQDQMVDTLDASSRAIRNTHQAIADIPFSILESIPATSAGARQVRRLHDLASDGIYSGISMLARWQKSRRKRSGDASPIETKDRGPI